MRKQLILVFLFLSFGVLHAQNVNGKVIDSNGTPLPGVNILEKNTTNGIVTDFDGYYSI
jgi:hypothetical protein